MNLYESSPEFRSAYNAALQAEGDRPVDWFTWTIKYQGAEGTIKLVACSRAHALTLLRSEHGWFDQRISYCRQGKKVPAPHEKAAA